MKKIIICIVGIFVAIILVLFNMRESKKTYQIECIGAVEFYGIQDNTVFSYWPLTPETAIKYLDNKTSEVGVSEESKKIRSILEKMNYDETVLVSVGFELDCISICEHDQGFIQIKSDALRVNKIYFYTSEFNGTYCRYY